MFSNNLTSLLLFKNELIVVKLVIFSINNFNPYWYIYEVKNSKESRNCTSIWFSNDIINHCSHQLEPTTKPLLYHRLLLLYPLLASTLIMSKSRRERERERESEWKLILESMLLLNRLKIWLMLIHQPIIQTNFWRSRTTHWKEIPWHVQHNLNCNNT